MVTTNQTIISDSPEAMYIELRTNAEFEIQYDNAAGNPTYILYDIATINEFRDEYLRAVPIIEQTAKMNGLVYDKLNLQSRRGQISISEIYQLDAERMLCLG